MCSLGDLLMPECGHAMMMRLKRLLVSVLGVFQRLPRVLLSRLVVLLSVFLTRSAMGVGGEIVKFRCPLVILVMRSIVIACGHN